MRFSALSSKDITTIMQVNCLPQVILTEMLLPKLKLKERAAIINMSSFSYDILFPFVGLYAATKSFNF